MKKNVMKTLSLFNFTEDDAEYLFSAKETMSEYGREIAEKFYKQLVKNSATKDFLPNNKAVAERVESLVKWYNNLFCGKYDEKYFQHIRKIGVVHVKIGLDSQFVNAGINYIRNFSIEAINECYKDSVDKERIKESMSKILDINLDIMTQSYRDAELKKVFLSHRLETALISVAERFTYGLNLVLVVALMGISIGVVFMFFKDIAHIVAGGDMGHGLISALGSLIIIWVMIELMETEVEHLKGKEFPAIIFIHVVLVSFIREVLVVSLQHDMKQQMMMVGTSFILGLIYWLVAKADKSVGGDR